MVTIYSSSLGSSSLFGFIDSWGLWVEGDYLYGKVLKWNICIVKLGLSVLVYRGFNYTCFCVLLGHQQISRYPNAMLVSEKQICIFV